MATAPPTNHLDQLEAFLARIEPFLDLWPALEVRYSAVRQAGEWRNLFTRVVFSWNRAPPVSQGMLALEDKFRAGRLTLQREGGIAWLRNLETGRFPVEDIEVHLNHVPIRSPDRSPSRYGWTELQLDRTGEARGLNQYDRSSVQGYALQGNGGVAWEVVSPEDLLRLEDSLFRFPQPFGGLGEFSTAYLGFPEAKTHGHATAFDIVAPFDTSFLGWSIREGKTFEGRIEHAPTVRETDLGIAAILTGPSGADRMQCHVAVGAGSSPDQLVTSSFSFPWRDYRSISLHLMLRGHAVDRMPVVFPASGSANPRFQSLLGLHRIGDLLSETLSQPGSIRESHRLEVLVCWILHLCGFQSVPTNLPEMDGGDVADVIAFDPYSNEGLVVEVTARDPLSNEKLAKLRTRADLVAGSVPSVTFYPVAVAVARDTFLPIEVETAQSLSIILLGRAELERLFELAQANELPGNILRRLFSGQS